MHLNSTGLKAYYAMTDGEYGDYEDGEIDPDCLEFYHGTY